MQTSELLIFLSIIGARVFQELFWLESQFELGERESRLCLELTWREGGGRQIAMQMIQTPFCVECRTEKCVSIRFLSPSFFKMLFEREEF